MRMMMMRRLFVLPTEVGVCLEVGSSSVASFSKDFFVAG